MLRFEPNRAWRRLQKHEQAVLITRALISDESSVSIAFTQNLDHDWIAALQAPNVKPTTKHSKELNRRMQEIMGFMAPMSFQFDTDNDGRLHVHGVISLPSIDQDTVSKFLEVLEKAGGYENHWQGYLDIHTSGGWNAYSIRNHDRTAEILKTDKLDYCSQAITRLARDAYEADLATRKESGLVDIVRSSEQATEAHTESPAPSAAVSDSETPEDSQRPSMAVSGNLDFDLTDLIDLDDQRRLKSMSGRSMADIEELLADL